MQFYMSPFFYAALHAALLLVTREEVWTISKNIMLPFSLFIDLFRLIILLDDYDLDYKTRTMVIHLEDALNKKLDAIQKREVYTEYKMASTDEEREQARQKYLDLAGIHRDWRWGAETELKRREL